MKDITLSAAVFERWSRPLFLIFLYYDEHFRDDQCLEFDTKRKMNIKSLTMQKAEKVIRKQLMTWEGPNMYECVDEDVNCDIGEGSCAGVL